LEFYLIRCGEADASRVADPYSARLSPAGIAQAEHIAQRCREWAVEFLCASTVARAQDTADIIARALSGVERWDLEELDDVNLDDLIGEPTAGPLVSAWTRAQLQLAHERVWSRAMGALARIVLYASVHDQQRVAIVSHDLVLRLLLLNWLGLDWRSAEEADLHMDHGATAKVTVGTDGAARVDWVNRI